MLLVFLLILLLLLLPDLINLHPLFIDNVLGPLLSHVLLHGGVLSTSAVLHFRFDIDWLSIQISFGLTFLITSEIQISDEVGVKRNHLGLQLVEQTLDLGFLSLLGGLKWIDFQSIEVGFTSTRNDDRLMSNVSEPNSRGAITEQSKFYLPRIPHHGKRQVYPQMGTT